MATSAPEHTVSPTSKDKGGCAHVVRKYDLREISSEVPARLIIWLVCVQGLLLMCRTLAELSFCTGSSTYLAMSYGVLNCMTDLLSFREVDDGHTLRWLSVILAIVGHMSSIRWYPTGSYFNTALVAQGFLPVFPSSPSILLRKDGQFSVGQERYQVNLSFASVCTTVRLQANPTVFPLLLIRKAQTKVLGMVELVMVNSQAAVCPLLIGDLAPGWPVKRIRCYVQYLHNTLHVNTILTIRLRMTRSNVTPYNRHAVLVVTGLVFDLMGRSVLQYLHYTAGKRYHTVSFRTSYNYRWSGTPSNSIWVQMNCLQFLGSTVGGFGLVNFRFLLPGVTLSNHGL